MNLNSELYLPLTAGQYSIGLKEEYIETLQFGNNSIVKREYLLASSPEHTVNIDKVCISRKLVSVKEFEEFINDSGYVTEAEKDGWAWTWGNGWKKERDLSWRTPTGLFLDEEYYQENLPVVQISCNDAAEYCKWSSMKNELTVRLPSESEWEIFAGMFLSSGGGIAEGLELKDRNLEVFVRKVIDSMPDANMNHQTGIFWEWTSDWYQAYPGGAANREYGEVYKVLKGGSLFSEDIQKIPQYRFRRCPTARSPFYALRLAVGNNG